MFKTFKCLNKNLKYLLDNKKLYSSKNFKDFENFAFKNSSTHDKNDKFENEKSNKDFSQVKSVIYTKRINLTKIYKNDLHYFKLEEDFEVHELRKKYLTLAKLYHPDLVKSNQDANFKFNKLQTSYERLKTFHEMRLELINLESEYLFKGNLSEDSKLRFEEINQEFFHSMQSEIFGNVKKEDYIKQLCKIVHLT
jgi:hypothetical protein